MKFVVSSTALLNVLQTLSKVVSNKNTLPILDNFLFDLKDGVLKITASDLETTLIGSLPVENMEEAGLMAVPVKLMLDSLKEFSEQPLSIEANESTWEINISWKTGKLTIPGTSGLSYPNLPELNSDRYRNPALRNQQNDFRYGRRRNASRNERRLFPLRGRKPHLRRNGRP